MYEKGVVTFGDWYKGQVKHPIYGFSRLQNVEVFENKGIAKIKNRSYLNYSTTQLPIAEVYDSYGNTYTLTGNTGVGVLYKNGVSLQAGLTNAWDIKIYRDYLWVANSSTLSAYGPLSSASAQYFANIDTGYSAIYNGVLLVGQDDYLYRGNANAVAKIEVLTSGTPTVAPTVSVNKTALDIKDGEYCATLTEFGTKILVGVHGGASYFDRNTLPIAKLYPWNRQLGTLGNPGIADLPVDFGENGINSVKSHANKLYVSAGTQGNIYLTDSTNYTKIATLPYCDSGLLYNSTVYLNAIAISSKGTLLVGVSTDLITGVRPGVYEIDINTSGYPIAYQTASSNTDGTLKIGFISKKNFQELSIGWGNNASYGVDTSDFRMYPSYGAIIETPMVRVGGYNSKKTFQHIEWCLADPLVSGQNIRISYRRNNKEGYTLINTWGFNTLGGVISFEDKGAITNCEYVQLKIELDQDITATFGYNVSLISVKLW